MRAQDNSIRKSVLRLIQSSSGVRRREITRHLQEEGYRLRSKALSATLRRMCDEGDLSFTGEPMQRIYWLGNEVEKVDEELEITQIILPARPGEFNFPHFATPIAWSMVHLLGA